MLVSFGRTAHTHGLYQLITYLHQRLSPGSQLASPQLSSIHRLTWLGAASSSGLVGGGSEDFSRGTCCNGSRAWKGGWQCLPSATERLNRATHLAPALPPWTVEDLKRTPMNSICFQAWAVVLGCVRWARLCGISRTEYSLRASLTG
jgi:hypothetical protein